jgi:hypothetical protein
MGPYMKKVQASNLRMLLLAHSAVLHLSAGTVITYAPPDH